MSSGQNVSRERRTRVTRQPIRDARIRVVGKAPLDAFVRTIPSSRMIELVVVSPWLSDGEGGCLEFRDLLSAAGRSEARVTVVTRPPTSASHHRAVEIMRAMKAHVSYNAALHSKILLARMADGSRYALVGSANLTHGSSKLIETAIILHSSARRSGPDAVDDLLSGPIRQALGHAGTTTNWHACDAASQGAPPGRKATRADLELLAHDSEP